MNITGHYPGATELITELHADYYRKHWGFDDSFNSQVEKELSEFIAEFKEDRDGFWTCSIEDKLVGAIAVDGRLAEQEGARIRWFIVRPEH